MCARRIGNGVENVYAAAAEWVNRALVNDDSLFTPGTDIWTAERLAKLRRRFLDQPDVSGDDFYVRLERQLAGSSPQTYQLMGEVLFVHFLIIWEPSMRSETKKERVERALGWGAPVGKIPVASPAAWRRVSSTWGLGGAAASPSWLDSSLILPNNGKVSNLVNVSACWTIRGSSRSLLRRLNLKGNCTWKAPPVIGRKWTPCFTWYTRTISNR